jgi:5-methyltetrahydropteroyltriglutamate--homocysteine methyltransferase
MNRIRTTHVGSLPRPKEVVEFLFVQDRGEPYDAAQLWGHAVAAV